MTDIVNISPEGQPETHLTMRQNGGIQLKRRNIRFTLCADELRTLVDALLNPPSRPPATTPAKAEFIERNAGRDALKQSTR